MRLATFLVNVIMDCALLCSTEVRRRNDLQVIMFFRRAHAREILREKQERSEDGPNKSQNQESLNPFMCHTACLQCIPFIHKQSLFSTDGGWT